MKLSKMARSITLIINYKTLILTALALISSSLCFHFGLTAKFPDMLIGVAIVFPVVFSIGSAFNRRETALQRLADFKGHAVAIYYGTRDWTSNKDNALPARAKQLIREIMELMNTMFKSTHDDQWMDNEKKLYQLFSQLSGLTMEMRNFGVQSGEISRVSQYVSKMIIAYDNMKIIHNYRSPVTLRAYSKVFIYMFPIIYGPYFASTFHDFSAQLEYVMPIMYSFILVSLDNIQDHLENPFDGVGEDDIRIEANETVDLLV
ncbi:MAG: hypothetical protein K1X47_08595 [Cyclobacteriaceae bacterium]|nr:hypothetical protein [Cyclobacteriaceae bacterium]